VSGLWQLLESPITDPASVRRRTDWLVAIHLVLTAAGLAVLALVAWRIRHFVTLSQRSNVETLLLAFVVILVAYLLVSTMRATIGAMVLLALRLAAPHRGQDWLQRRAARAARETKRAYLNVRVTGPAPGPIEVPIADDRGPLGRLRLADAEVALVEVPANLSHSVANLAVRVLARDGEPLDEAHEPRIVVWGVIDEEAAERYAAMVHAFARLEAALGHGPLWPAVRLGPAGIGALHRVMREAAPALREDVLLPDIEYSAQFSIPIVPEPLAFVQLTRRSEHADPVASLGAATLIVLVLLGLAAWLVVAPPWVPGR
jgi:hypothetical protein